LLVPSEGRIRFGRIVKKYATHGFLGRLSSSTVDCREHGLSIAHFRILLEFRIPFSRFLNITVNEIIERAA
jgi:hypothetical protein